MIGMTGWIVYAKKGKRYHEAGRVEKESLVLKRKVKISLGGDSLGLPSEYTRN